MKIGLEIHVQLATKSKLFCTCPSDFLDAEPNINICPICTGQPGSKPMGLNKEALTKAITLALAFSCKIKKSFKILRKHYFYPDLPNNYQRTSEPLGEKGNFHGVRIREIHIEEDPGRYDLKKGLVDYNRSGVPLVEIVTEPDLKSPDDTENFLKELKTLLDYLEIQKYRETGMRVDVNISLEGGARVEIKNINSIESVKRALLYEISRQKRILESSGEVKRETRHWDEERGVTISLREKETAEDYRYMPDPDLPPVEISEGLIEDLRAKMPELPWERVERLVKEYGIPESSARMFVLDKELSELFEKIAKKTDKKFAFTFASMLRGELNYRGTMLRNIPKSERLEKLADLYFKNRVTKPVAVEHMRKILDDPSFEPGEETAVNEEELDKIIKKVISENKKVVEDYLSGEEKALNYLVGLVLKETKGKADPKKVFEKLKGQISR